MIKQAENAELSDGVAGAIGPQHDFAEASSRYIKLAVAVMATLLVALAISYLEHLGTTGAGRAFGFFATLAATGSACSLSDTVAALPLGLFVYITPPPLHKTPKSAICLALLLDLIAFMSAAMGSTHHLAALFADRSHVVLSLLFFIVLGVYFVYLARFGFDKAREFVGRLFVGGSVDGEAVNATSADSGAKLSAVVKVPAIKSKTFWLSFVILLIAWSPYVVSFAPGSDCPDMGWEILQFTSGNYSSHHPLYATFIYGIVFSAGNALKGVNAGLLFCTLFQTIALALVLALEILELERLSFKSSVLIAVLVFFALAPVFGSYCQWIVKDSLFGACFALYATVFVRCYRQVECGEIPIRSFVLLLVVSIAAGLLRNNGFYVAALAALTFALVFRKRLGALKMLMVLTVIPLTMLANQAALTLTHAQKGDAREALSIPFQQTARCAAEHADDVTKAERKAIGAVLDYSDLASRYKWHISDPVKNKANTADKQALLEYFKVWFAQGLRHPLCYIEATLDQTFGYWSLVDPAIYAQEWTGFGNGNVAHSLGSESRQFFPSLAAQAAKAVSALKAAPFIKQVSVSGFYTLAGLVLAAFAIYRGKPRTLLLLLPSALLLLTCIAGPLNGSMRYSFGFIVAFPIVAGALVHDIEVSGKVEAEYQ